MPDGTRPTPTISTWRDHVRPTADGCLIWTGRIDPNGYARLGGKWAHRAVYLYEGGHIPEGHELDHTCQTPPCVNPRHLDAVTRAEHCRRTMRRLGKDELHLSAAYLRTLGMTYADVADALGLTTRTGAKGAVDAAIRKGLVSADDVPRAHFLTEQDMGDMQALRALGVPINDIAEWYGIDSSTASRVSRGLRSGRRRTIEGDAA